MIASAAYRLRAMPTPFAPARILAQDLDRFWGGRSEALPDYVHAVAGLGKVRAAQQEYEAAIAAYRSVVERYPAPDYVIGLGDVYRATGQAKEAAKQYALVEIIDRLYEASGINTDLQMALFFADHDIRLDEALRQAWAAFEARPSVQAADVLSWALYKNGAYEEALTYSHEALRLGTRDALMLFHAGMISYAVGDHARARDYLQQVAAINPRFSTLYADDASALLQSLQVAVSAS